MTARSLLIVTLIAGQLVTISCSKSTADEAPGMNEGSPVQTDSESSRVSADSATAVDGDGPIPTMPPEFSMSRGEIEAQFREAGVSGDQLRRCVSIRAAAYETAAAVATGEFSDDTAERIRNAGDETTDEVEEALEVLATAFLELRPDNAANPAAVAERIEWAGQVLTRYEAEQCQATPSE